MDKLYLIKPTMAYAEQIMDIRREIFETDGENGFDGCSSLQNYGTAEGWLDHLARFEDPATVPAGYVPSTTYLAVRAEDDRVVGIIDLRHHIDHPILSVWGGHIGYSVRPADRGHGYAKEMLRLNLENCRARGMKKVLITCHRGNIASEKTILANGGIFDGEVSLEDGTVHRFWITL